MASNSDDKEDGMPINKTLKDSNSNTIPTPVRTMTEPRTESGNHNQVHLLLEEKANTQEDDKMSPNDTHNSQEGDEDVRQIDFSTEKNSMGPPLHVTQQHKGSDAKGEKTQGFLPREFL